ncbi:hypothetical protein PYCC9005_000158 [Savitreella phatthalungensis]
MSQVAIRDIKPGCFEDGNFIRGVVALRWPYSASKHTISIALADEDIRKRLDKGQVKITFHGKAADALKTLATFTRLELSTSAPSTVKFEPFKASARDIDHEITFHGSLLIKRGDFGDSEELDSRPSPAVDTPVRLRRTWDSPADIRRGSPAGSLGLDDAWFGTSSTAGSALDTDTPAAKRQKFATSFRYIPSTQGTPSATPLKNRQLNDGSDIVLPTPQREQLDSDSRREDATAVTLQGSQDSLADLASQPFLQPLTPLRPQQSLSQPIDRSQTSLEVPSSQPTGEPEPSRLGFKTPTPAERPPASPVVRPTPPAVEPELINARPDTVPSQANSVAAAGDYNFDLGTPRHGPQVHFSEPGHSAPATPRNVPYLDLASANEQEDLFRKLRASVPPKSDAGSSMMADEEENEGELAIDKEPSMLDRQAQIQERILRRKINSEQSQSISARAGGPELGTDTSPEQHRRASLDGGNLTTRSNIAAYGNSSTGEAAEQHHQDHRSSDHRERQGSPSMTERGAAVQESVFRSKIGQDNHDNASAESVKSSVLVEPAPPSVDDNASVVHVNKEPSMLEQQNSVQETLFRQKLDQPVEVEPGNLSLVGRAPGSHHGDHDRPSGDIVDKPREPSMLEQQTQVQEEIFRDKVDAAAENTKRVPPAPASLDHMEQAELRHRTVPADDNPPATGSLAQSFSSSGPAQDADVSMEEATPQGGTSEDGLQGNISHIELPTFIAEEVEASAGSRHADYSANHRGQSADDQDILLDDTLNVDDVSRLFDEHAAGPTAGQLAAAGPKSGRSLVDAVLVANARAAEAEATAEAVQASAHGNILDDLDVDQPATSIELSAASEARPSSAQQAAAQGEEAQDEQPATPDSVFDNLYPDGTLASDQTQQRQEHSPAQTHESLELSQVQSSDHPPDEQDDDADNVMFDEQVSEADDAAEAVDLDMESEAALPEGDSGDGEHEHEHIDSDSVLGNVHLDRGDYAEEIHIDPELESPGKSEDDVASGDDDDDDDEELEAYEDVSDKDEADDSSRQIALDGEQALESAALQGPQEHIVSNHENGDLLNVQADGDNGPAFITTAIQAATGEFDELIDGESASESESESNSKVSGSQQDIEDSVDEDEDDEEAADDEEIDEAEEEEVEEEEEEVEEEEEDGPATPTSLASAQAASDAGEAPIDPEVLAMDDNQAPNDTTAPAVASDTIAQAAQAAPTGDGESPIEIDDDENEVDDDDVESEDDQDGEEEGEDADSQEVNEASVADTAEGAKETEAEPETQPAATDASKADFPIADDSIPAELRSTNGLHTDLRDLRFDSTVDIVGVIISAEPARRTDGPDYVWRAQIAQSTGTLARLAVYRPRRDLLPDDSVAPGAAVVLRSFRVTTRAPAQIQLKSQPDSTWAIWSPPTTPDAMITTDELDDAITTVSSIPSPDIDIKEYDHGLSLIKWYIARGHRLTPPDETAVQETSDSGEDDGARASSGAGAANQPIDVDAVIAASQQSQKEASIFPNTFDVRGKLIYAPSSTSNPYVFYLASGTSMDQQDAVCQPGVMTFAELAPELPDDVLSSLSPSIDPATLILPVHIRTASNGASSRLAGVTSGPGAGYASDLAKLARWMSTTPSLHRADPNPWIHINAVTIDTDPITNKLALRLQAIAPPSTNPPHPQPRRITIIPSPNLES